MPPCQAIVNNLNNFFRLTFGTRRAARGVPKSKEEKTESESNVV